MEETVSIHEVFKILRNRWKLILFITLLAASISGGISYYLLTPVYQASTQILVNQKDSENRLDFSQLRNNIELINTYSVIIKSPVILEKVIVKLDLKKSVEQLNKSIKVSSQDNSQVFSLTIEDSNPAKAVEIANAVSETFQEEIKAIMNVDNISILARAEKKDNPIPVKPKRVMNVTLGIVIGILLGIGLSFLLEYMDKSIKGSEDVIAYLDLPVLGTIQKMPLEKNKQVKRIVVSQKLEGETFET